MRFNLTKQNSTKAERRFYELLKQLDVEFKHRWLIKGREVDFVVGRYAIDIDGHEQDIGKNDLLVSEGYIPVHYHNNEIEKLKLKDIKYVFN